MTQATPTAKPSPSLAHDELAPFPPRRRHLVLAGTCVAVVYLLGVTNAWWPTPDSAMYQGLGRSLFAGQGYRFNGEINTDVTPGMPLVFGFLHWAFGEGYWAANLFVCLCALGALAVAYATMSRWTSRRMAFAVVLGTAVLYRYYDYAHLILTDATFALLFWLTLYCGVRYLQGSWGWLLGVVTLAGLSVAVRAPGITILGPLAVAIVADTSTPSRPARRALLAAGILLAIAAAALCFYQLARSLSPAQPAYVGGPATRVGLWGRFAHLGEGLWKVPGEFARIFTSQASGLVGLVLCALAALGAWRLWPGGRRLSALLLGLYIVPSTFLIGYGTIRARYLMPVYPLMLLLILHGLFRVVEGCCRRNRRWERVVGHIRARPYFRRLGRLLEPVERLCRWEAQPVPPVFHLRAATVFIALLAVVNAPRVLRQAFYFSYAGHTGRFWQVIEDGHYAELQAMADFLRDHFGGDDVIATRRDRASMLHYLSGRRTIQFFKTARWRPEHAEAVHDDLFQQRKKLLEEGRDIAAVITDSGGLDSRYTRRLAELLDATGGLKVVHKGKYCTVYLRVGPLTRPATQPTSGPAP